MIPKRIFYVWGYGEPKSTLANICLENWRIMLPDYEIIEINEKTPQWFDFDFEYNNNLWFKTVYDLKMWAYVADYMRVKTLYDHGGIYLDTDVTVYKKFDDLLEENMFIGNTTQNIPDLGIFGAQKNNLILSKMYDFYKEKIWKEDLYVITFIFLSIFNKLYNQTIIKDRIIKEDLVTIYPYDYFQPFNYNIEFDKRFITNRTYTAHWQNGSWQKKKFLYFLANKHRIPLKTLLNQLSFIEKMDKNANKKVQIKEENLCKKTKK